MKPFEETSGSRKAVQDCRGYVLLGSVLLMLILTSLGLVALLTSDVNIQMGSSQLKGMQAFYIAEAGLQRAVQRVSTNPNWINSLPDKNNAFPSDNTVGEGSYVVSVYKDDPSVGRTRIRSTGTTHGGRAASATVETILTEAATYPEIFDYVMANCGNLELGAGVNAMAGSDVFVSGNLEMKVGNNTITGNVNVMGNAKLENLAVITGSVLANGNAEVSSSPATAVTGNVTAGGNFSGTTSKVKGKITTKVTPLPVTNICVGSKLKDISLTKDLIQNYRLAANATYDNYEIKGGMVNHAGVVWVKGNLKVEGAVTLQNDVVFVVDGNVEIKAPGSIKSIPPGATATFLVPNGNLYLISTGIFQLDGAVQIGAVDENGGNKTGGNLEIKDLSQFVVNGSVQVLNGNLKADSTARVTITYKEPTNPILMTGTGGAGERIWREVRN